MYLSRVSQLSVPHPNHLSIATTGSLLHAQPPATAAIEKEARHPAGRPKFNAALTESAWRAKWRCPQFLSSGDWSLASKSQPPYAVQTDGHGGLVDRPNAPSVCSTGARHVLSLTAENLLFPATLGAVVGEIGRPHATELGALAALLGLVGGQSRLLRFSPVPPKKPRRVCVLRAGLRFLNAPRWLSRGRCAASARRASTRRRRPL